MQYESVIFVHHFEPSFPVRWVSRYPCNGRAYDVEMMVHHSRYYERRPRYVRNGGTRAGPSSRTTYIRPRGLDLWITPSVATIEDKILRRSVIRAGPCSFNRRRGVGREMMNGR